MRGSTQQPLLLLLLLLLPGVLPSHGSGPGFPGPHGMQPVRRPAAFVLPAWRACLDWGEEVKQFEYVKTKGVRIVPPYTFGYRCNAKKRWVGRPVEEVFAAEFPHFRPSDPLGYFTEAVLAGRLRRVGDEATPLGRPMRASDELLHITHRHEPPVSAAPVRVLHDGGGVVAVDKPSTLPVHPTGRFRRNTVLGVLAKEASLPSLKVVHRLDRLTSGLLLLAHADSNAAADLSAQFAERRVRKRYLARVHGRLPQGSVVVDTPVRCKSHVTGEYEAHPDGKAAQTVLRELAHRGEESLVLAEPLTGRTHQIRLHLQGLGVPISNDPLYNPRAPRPPPYLGAENMPELSLERNGWLEDWCALCSEARAKKGEGYYTQEKAWSDDASSTGIYLHALTLEGEGWEFAAPWPEWARELAGGELPL